MRLFPNTIFNNLYSGDDGLKRLERTVDTGGTAGSSISLFEVVKSGSNWVKITWSGVVISVWYSTDRVSWSASQESGGNYTDDCDKDIFCYGILRKISNRLHLTYSYSNLLRYAYSDDDGESWTLSTSGVEYGDTAGDNSSGVFDFCKIGATYYIFCIDNWGAGLGLYIYDTAFTLKDTVSISQGSNMASGYTDGSLHYFLVSDKTLNYDNYIYSFDGTDAALVETISLNNSAYFNAGYQCLFKVGNAKYFTLRSGGSSYLYKEIDGTWTNLILFDAYKSNIMWRDQDNLEPKYFCGDWTGAALYYFNPAGYMIKFSQDTIANSGYDDYTTGYKIDYVSYNPDKCLIPFDVLETDKLNLTHLDTDYIKGDGIILSDDSSNKIFQGPIIDIDNSNITYQIIKGESPAIYDLDNEITVDLEQTFQEILYEVLADTGFLYTDETGIDNPATDIETGGSYTGKLRDLFLLLERAKTKKIYWDIEGKVYADDADEVTGTSYTDYMKCDVSKEGAGMNAVLLYGGSGSTLITSIAYDPKSDNQQINLFKDVYSSITVQATLDTLATTILASRDAAFKRYTFMMFGEGRPQIGQTISYTNATYSISAEAVIVKRGVYNAILDKCTVSCETGLFFENLFNIKLPEANREVINQIINGTTLGSTTFTGDVRISKSSGDTILTVKAAAGGDDVFVVLDTMDDAAILIKENNANRVWTGYEEGANSQSNYLYQAGDFYVWHTSGAAEKMRLTTDDLTCAVNVNPSANKGHDLGLAAKAWDDVYCDDVQDVASEKKFEYTQPIDALRIINKISNIDNKTDYDTIEFARKFKVRQYEIEEEIEKPNKTIEIRKRTEREEVPLDYKEDPNETYEIHHSRSLTQNIDILNAALKQTTIENAELKTRVKNLEKEINAILTKLERG